MYYDFRKGFYDCELVTNSYDRLIKLLDKTEIKYDPKYKETFATLTKSKKLTLYVNTSEAGTNKLFDDLYSPFGKTGNMTTVLINKIIIPVINNYFNSSKFMDEFYKTYISDYMIKMANTVKNYTVDNSSMSLLFSPFETGWIKFTKFMKSRVVIDELTSDIFYIMNKYNVKFDNSLELFKPHKKLTTTMYNMLIHPKLEVSRLCKKYNLKSSNDPIYLESEGEFNNTPQCSIFDCEDYFYTYGNKKIVADLIYNDTVYGMIDDCDQSMLIPINFVKSIVRYVFVSMFKQAIPYYISKRRYRDPVLDSVISDIELYFTKNISVLRGNDIYYQEKVKLLSGIIARNDEDIIRVSRKDVDSTLYEIHNQITNENKAIFEEVISMKDRETGIYPIEAFEKLLSIIEKLLKNTQQPLKKSYNFSIVERWNELLETNTIWIPSDYINTISGLIK